MAFPETFSSMKAKMNNNVQYAIEQMNLSLVAICEDEKTKPKDKLKATQDYLGMYMRLVNEISQETEKREVMKQRKLVTLIKQHEVAEIESKDRNDGKIPSAIVQSRFDPNMSVS